MLIAHTPCRRVERRRLNGRRHAVEPRLAPTMAVTVHKARVSEVPEIPSVYFVNGAPAGNIVSMDSES